MARFNIKDSFEQVYMREKTLSRTLKDVDVSIMKETDFKRVVKYMCSDFAKRYGKSLLRNGGFDESDIHSMVNIYALSFVGGKYFDRDKVSKKGYFYLMMRHIEQRLVMWHDWSVKKFNDSEVVSMTTIKPGLSSTQPAPVSDADLLIKGIDMIDLEIDNVALTKEDRKEILKKKNFAKFRLLKIKKGTERQLTTKQKVEARSKDLSSLRSKLDKDIDKKSDILIHYATVKHVAPDVRKAARAMCRKYGIDYKKGIQAKISEKGLDQRDFNVK